MSYVRFSAVPGLLALVLAATTAAAQQSTPMMGGAVDRPAQSGAAPSLDTLLQQFEANAPEEPEGSVRLDAWVESNDNGSEVVVVVTPEGETKLVADPGITVTPASRAGVDWRSPLPYRLVDVERDYLDPPATARIPFNAQDDRPLQLLVEYAYCVVDYQCFFGEEELTVANATPG